MSTKRVTITLDNIDGLDLFFKLMRDDVDKVLATRNAAAIKAKLSEVQEVRAKVHGSYQRHIKTLTTQAKSKAKDKDKEPKAHRYRPCYAIELYKALIRISAEQFNLVLAKLIAGLKDCAQK